MKPIQEKPTEAQQIHVYDGKKKDLLFLLREYPLGYTYARDRLHKAFKSQARLSDEKTIKDGLARADFVRKGAFSDGRFESQCSLAGRHFDIESPPPSPPNFRAGLEANAGSCACLCVSAEIEAL